MWEGRGAQARRRGPLALLLLLLAGAAAPAHSLAVDPDAASEVREAAAAALLSRGGDGEVALVVRGAAAAESGREAILRALVAPDDAVLSLYYNRKSEKVSLESRVEGERRSVWWEVRRAHAGTLVLAVGARGVRLHAGCRPLQAHAASELGHRDLLRLLAHRALKLHHDEDSPMEVYSTESAALDALGCDDADDENRAESDMVEVRDIADADARNKREDREPTTADDYINNYIAQQQQNAQRGDQPSRGFESCDDALIRELINLRKTVDALRGDIARQGEQMDALRRKQEQCCHPAPTAPPPAPPTPRCVAGSCYPGY